ncbi:hypothetical protein D3C73_1464970 [compost metagenome]
MARVRPRAWRNRASPAGVGSTPRLLRLNSVVPKRASMSEIRLLTAEGAMNARSPARAMVPSSQTTMNRCKDRWSRGCMAVSG